MVPSPSIDSESRGPLAEAERALAAAGLGTGLSHGGEQGAGAPEAELTIGEADEKSCRRILAAAGFAPLPGRAGHGRAELWAFDPETGWAGIRLRVEGRSGLTGLRSPRVRGLGVAIMGPDGAGKSTLIENLERSFPVRVHSIYMGLYQGEESRAPSRFTIPGIALLRNVARQQARWLRGLRERLRGSLVVFDRYTYDSLLPTGRPISRLGRLRRGLLGHACPAPDLVVVLDAPAEVLFARKGEHDLELLDLHRRGLLELAGRLPRATVVDASRQAGEVAGDVTAAIWARHRRRSA